MRTPSFSRRSMLGLIGGSSLAMALTPSAAFAQADPAAPGIFQAPSRLSRPDRVFLQRGLMHGAWVRSGSADGWFPDAALWQQSGFTTPTFYNPPLWSDEVMAPLEALEQYSWSLAKGPVGQSLANPALRPPADQEWLTPDQLAHVDSLFTACFGDEEAYANDIVSYLAAAYAATHERHPYVLVHNNQALAQYTDAQARTYIQTAKPDLVSFDFYYWQRGSVNPGGSPNAVYKQTGRYRRLALEGLDGTGSQPIAFGQYTCGFRLIPGAGRPAGSRQFIVSESQQHIVSNVTWALGGKWLDLFRWEKGPGTPSYNTDGQFLNYADGTPTPQFYRYVELNAAMRAYSPYLTRLRTQATGLVRGINGDTGALNPVPGEVPDFSATTDPGAGVLGLRAVNVGSVNKGARGDVVFGSFRQLPDMRAGENRGVLPDKDSTSAFMIVNGLTVQNTDPYSYTGSGGSGEDTRQVITVTVDPTLGGTRRSGATLYVVNKASGHLAEVATAPGEGGRTFSVSIKGGQSELYIWA